MLLQIDNLNLVSLWNQILDFLNDYIVFPLKNITIVNIIDIVVLSFLIYMVYKFIRDRHAGRTIIGLGLLILLYAVSEIFGMVAINSILSNFYTVGIVALVVGAACIGALQKAQKAYDLYKKQGIIPEKEI